MENRLDLLAFVEECGSLEDAAFRLKIGAAKLGNACLGLAPIPPKLRRKSFANGGAGREVLDAYVRMVGGDINEAAESLEVTPGYLLQQSGLTHPTGAVVNEMRRRIEDAARRAAVPEEVRLAAQKKMAEALARRAATRQPKPGSKEWIEAHNARVLAERKAARQAKR